jgi:hypothetical protein
MHIKNHKTHPSLILPTLLKTVADTDSARIETRIAPVKLALMRSGAHLFSYPHRRCNA